MNNITLKEIIKLEEFDLLDLCFQYPYEKQWEHKSSYEYALFYIDHIYKRDLK